MVKDWILNRLQFLKADKNGSATEDFSANGLTSTNLTVDTNLIKTDSANNRVGINKTTPAKTLDIVGNGEVTADFTVGTDLSVTGNFATLLKAVLGAEITDFLKMLSGGSERSFIRTTSSGTIEIVSNARWNGTQYILGYEGSTGAQLAIKVTLSSAGTIQMQRFSGTAGDVISDWAGNGLGYIHTNMTTSFLLGLNRTSNGSVEYSMYADGAAGSTVSAQIKRLSGTNGSLDIANRGTGEIRFLGTDLATVAAYFDSSLNLNLNQNLNMATGKVLNLNSIPLGGFSDAGTPIRIKIIEAGFGGALTVTTAHGMAGSPVTNNKIIGLIAGNDVGAGFIIPASGSGNSLKYAYIDDTNVFAEGYAATLGIARWVVFYID